MTAGSDDTMTRTVPTAVVGEETMAAAATFEITVVEGPDAGLSFVVDGTREGPTLVGQSSVCHVRLSDRQVSRRHLELDLAARQLRVTDLGSMNATTVDGLRVREAFLRGGEVVRLAQTALRVTLAAPATVIPMAAAAAFGRVIGRSPEMRRLFPFCERIARSDLPVIIEGETGTGKELLAESLHEQGPRAAGPFVVFDCTAVASNLIESELFGHERGAFTGAVTARRGLFEQASGGTLLIDEIGDLPAPLQPKLLRALERSEVRRVGGERTLKVDARILCATRRDLDREVQAGRFRDDLFHRLAVARIELPPLRRRKGEIVVLARAFAEQLGQKVESIPDSLLRAWEDYAWPGNVRELRNAVARHLAFGDLLVDQAARPRPSAQVPLEGDGALEQILSMGLDFTTARQRVLSEFERRYVERVLGEHGGNVMRAAAASGIARRYFQKVKGRVQR